MFVLVTVVLITAACAGNEPSDDAAVDAAHPLFGATELLSDVVGSDLLASEVVPMACIPSRTDPVGVFLGLRIVDWQVEADMVSVSIRSNHARLGSHPSGCSDPMLVMQDSMFLLGPDDEAVHASRAVEADGATTLVFDLDDRSAAGWSAVLLPTIDYALGNGDRQTSIFGFVGHYALA